jgi:hypothetical protein
MCGRTLGWGSKLVVRGDATPLPPKRFPREKEAFSRLVSVMTMGDRLDLDSVMGFVTIPHFDTEYDKADGARVAAKRADASIFIIQIQQYVCRVSILSIEQMSSRDD